MKLINKFKLELKIHLPFIFWLNLFFIFVYIASVNVYSNKVYILISLVWLIILNTKKKNYSPVLTTIFFMLLFLAFIFYPLDYIFNTYQSEKFASLASLFLSLSAIGFLWGTISKQEFDTSILRFIKEFLTFTEVDIKYPRFRELRIKIRTVLKRIYGPVPRTMNEFRFFAPRAILSVIFITIFAITINIIHMHQIRESRKPTIQDIQPHIFYKSLKVIVYGNNLGFKPNEDALRLMSQFGEVQKEEWTDKKIIFTVPQTWNVGEIDLWVEKPVEWGGKTEIIRTKINKLKLLPITQKFTPADDEFFKDLPNLKKEVRDINGYK